MRGHVHAAKRMLDAERERRRPNRQAAKKKRIRCNAPWARQFVPGPVESGVDLPEGVQQSSLISPPDVKVWVARYSHPTLQNAGKRPTRSKSFKDGNTSEHSAFQVALSWLWSRHESMAKKCTRPSWVTQVLDKCPPALLTDPGSLYSIEFQQEWAEKHSAGCWEVQ